MGTKIIDLLKYRGKNSSLFTGRPQGECARVELGLDSCDESQDIIKINIPKGTSSINPSFFLGLLFQSIKKLGIERFEQKYIFVIEDENEEVRTVLLSNLDDGKRNATNEILNKTGLKRFIDK